MRDGFIRVGAATSNVVVANPIENARNIVEKISKASRNKVRVLTFQELALSGYTCGDLFLQDTLLDGCLEGLEMIRKYSVTKDMLIVVGLPMKNNNKIYNVAAFINKGNYLGFVPKTFIPNYEDFYETRYFTKPGKNTTININGTNYPFGTNLLFKCNNMSSLVVACEIGEDLYAPISPSTHHALNGANVILNLAASSEVLTSAKERVDFIRNHSKKIIASYIYASAGEGESTQDSVFASHNIIAENGVILKESELFKNELVFVEVDTKYLSFERSKKDMFALEESEYTIVHFDISNKETPISREFDKAPFSPKDEKDLDKILLIQAYGLKKRIEHTHTKKLILGLSGGLDSTLAVLVMAKSLELLNRSNKDILAVSMPCFGTTDLTKTNAYKLAKALGVTFKEINIKASVTQHFKDIEQDIDNYDVTYENSQARERTQVLMDLANKVNGMVIGTGDLSELALGWATYNGDHMSMYAVNASIPKTLMRSMIGRIAKTTENKELKEVLLSIIDTPVSPELLPPKDGQISQITEDLVGPYELHDFFLYNTLKNGYDPLKVYRISCLVFNKKYSNDTIKYWLKTFYRRFFNQQFKRSCLPDGVKAISISLSPRSDLKMPSDASNSYWLKEIEKIV